MPRVAGAASSSAATPAAARPAGSPRPRAWFAPLPRPAGLRLQLHARGARREGVRTAAGEEEEEVQARLTLYDLLGISPDGSPQEVRAAYRRMALRYHPDVSAPGAAAENTRRFIEVQEAYETLSDPGRRASYDRALARGVCRLAFSASRSARTYYRQDQEEKSDWRRSWEDQVAELKRRSMAKDSEENLSWGARMRRRAESSSSAE